jgi:hypothetical protein
MGAVRWRRLDNGKIEEIHKVVVKKIYMSDVEDPDLYVADHIYQWQQTPRGKFIMDNAIEPPRWQRFPDHETFGFKYTIIAELEVKKLSEFYLRWGNPLETN